MSTDTNSSEGLSSEASAQINLKDQAKQEADGFIDDVREEIIEAKDNLIQELKATVSGLLNSVFGDFNLFWSVFKTFFKWFFKPLAFTVRQVEKENLQRAGEGLKPRYFTDFALMKSLFMLSLTFLVIEDAATGASTDQWIMQVVFFLFFVVLLFAFIGIMWLWKSLLGIKTGDARVFIGFIIYQYAAIYTISFIVNGPLGLNTNGEIGNDLLLVIYFLPLLQSIYFLIRLMNYYKVSKGKKIVGFVIGTAFFIFFLFLPAAANQVFLAEGIDTSGGTNTEFVED